MGDDTNIEKQLISTVNGLMYHQMQERVYTEPVYVIMDCGVLQKKHMRNGGSEECHILNNVVM